MARAAFVKLETDDTHYIYHSLAGNRCE